VEDGRVGDAGSVVHPVPGALVRLDQTSAQGAEPVLPAPFLDERHPLVDHVRRPLHRPGCILDRRRGGFCRAGEVAAHRFHRRVGEEVGVGRGEVIERPRHGVGVPEGGEFPGGVAEQAVGVPVVTHLRPHQADQRPQLLAALTDVVDRRHGVGHLPQTLLGPFHLLCADTVDAVGDGLVALEAVSHGSTFPATRGRQTLASA
jgi:hypothetical protein